MLPSLGIFLYCEKNVKVSDPFPILSSYERPKPCTHLGNVNWEMDPAGVVYSGLSCGEPDGFNLFGKEKPADQSNSCSLHGIFLKS